MPPLHINSPGIVSKKTGGTSEEPGTQERCSVTPLGSPGVGEVALQEESKVVLEGKPLIMVDSSLSTLGVLSTQVVQRKRFLPAAHNAI